ncbi:pancreatic triacylglycerol lipase-like, partial [Macrobrachium rosenbergii]|uniref:pancreatic triacylglycerol lipase-like n=1 Tax=Macrobrachium rosenbergii TaxID=79674 RepID=UPI0034D783E4
FFSENQGEQTVLQPGDNTPTLQIDDNGPTLPASLVLNVNLDDVHFLLWTRSNSDNDADYELVIDDVSNLKASPFDGTKPTVILCHGWNSEGTASWIYRAKTEFLQWQDINFISVEWSSIARHINYLEVVNNIPKIGKHIAAFIDYLYKEGGLNVTDLYVAGHSLGAHVVGIAGLNVQNGPVGRITGLDPAGPGFEGASDDVRLDKSDAAFVDVIHTSACPQSKICLGLSGSFGHVDFFPNGGGSQPGCEVLGPVGDALSGCSHKRAYEYWTESVNGLTKFKSVPCPDWNSFRAGNCVACGQGCLNMGVHVNKQLRGDYYLETNANRPYAKG